MLLAWLVAKWLGRRSRRLSRAAGDRIWLGIMDGEAGRPARSPDADYQRGWRQGCEQRRINKATEALWLVDPAEQVTGFVR